MLALLLIAGLLAQSESTSAQSKPPASQVEPKAVSETETISLPMVKRIFVDTFGDDAFSKEMQSMIVSALVATNKFIVTENRDRADAILRGVATEKTSQELHAYSEGTAVDGRNGAAAIRDSSANTETVQEARIAVRLVDPNGDIIWTSTQESKGAKYKGSGADAAEKCVKQLVRDVDKLRAAKTPTLNSPSPTPSPASASANHR